MLNVKTSGKDFRKSDDLNRLLLAIESAAHDTTLLALNMTMEAVNADANDAAELADAVGKLSICANHFSHQIRGCVLAGGSKLDAHGWLEVRRVTRDVAELIGEVSGFAGEALEGMDDPSTEGRWPEVVRDVLEQVRNRARVLDQLLHALPDPARGTRAPS